MKNKNKKFGYVYHCKGYKKQATKKMWRDIAIMAVIYAAVLPSLLAVSGYYQHVKELGNISNYSVNVAKAQTIETQNPTIKQQVEKIVRAYFPKDKDFNYLMNVIQPCENINFDPRARNPINTSSGHAVGIWQITEGTWKESIANYRPHWTMADITDPLKNTEMAMLLWRKGESWRWECPI